MTNTTDEDLRLARERMEHAQTAVADAMADMQKALDHAKVTHAAMTDAFLQVLVDINRHMQERAKQ